MDDLIANLVCDDKGIFLEIEGVGYIAEYEGKGKWRSLHPGWKVSTVSLTRTYGKISIEHDGKPHIVTLN